MKYVFLLVLGGINKHKITISYIESFGHEKDFKRQTQYDQAAWYYPN